MGRFWGSVCDPMMGFYAGSVDEGELAVNVLLRQVWLNRDIFGLIQQMQKSGGPHFCPTAMTSALKAK